MQFLQLFSPRHATRSAAPGILAVWLVVASGAVAEDRAVIRTGLATGSRGISSGPIGVFGDWVLFTVHEASQGQVDLNDDGDVEDYVAHALFVPEGNLKNLGLATGFSTPSREQLPGHPGLLAGSRVLVEVSESAQGAADRNGDGDAEDRVLEVYDLLTDATKPLAVPGSPVASGDAAFVIEDSGNLVVLTPTGEERLTFRNSDSVCLDGGLMAFSRYDVVDSPGADGAIVGLYDLDRAEELEFDLPGTPRSLHGDWMVLERSSTDGELPMLSLVHLGTRERRTLIDRGNIDLVDSSEQWVVFDVAESGEAGGIGDLNADGDTGDSVVFVHDIARNLTRNTGLTRYISLVRVAARRLSFTNRGWIGPGPLLSVAGSWLLVRVGETQQGADLNGDGDSDDVLYHAENLESGATFVWDRVVYALEGGWLANPTDEFRLTSLESEATFNVGVRASAYSFCGIFGRWVLFALSEATLGEDLNGNGGAFDTVLHVVDRTCLAPLLRPFLRGDCDGDGDACSGVADAVELLNWLFLGRTVPPCLAACDPDGNGELELADAVYGLNFCFKGTDAPVTPFPGCGPGTEMDTALGCEASACE